MDDFGTGYSSLSQLRQLPIDYTIAPDEVRRDLGRILAAGTNASLEGDRRQLPQLTVQSSVVRFRSLDGCSATAARVTDRTDVGLQSLSCPHQFVAGYGARRRHLSPPPRLIALQPMPGGADS